MIVVETSRLTLAVLKQPNAFTILTHTRLPSAAVNCVSSTINEVLVIAPFSLK
jgi:hypothetical protein